MNPFAQWNHYRTNTITKGAKQMIPESMLAGFRETLFLGKFNLLLGAGVSRDAVDSNNQPIEGAAELRVKLCTLKELNNSSSLARATGYLTPDEREKHITSKFRGCVAGPTGKMLTQFVWSQIYTLNIDDVLENAYETTDDTRQKSFSVNFDAPYETFRHRIEVPIIHLHGWSLNPKSGYVFSNQEYARVQRQLNPWMHLLSDLIKTEPFIISGTSLTEPDLEYYLSHRADGHFDSRRPLSILVEPFPDAGTQADCERFRLVLVKATLSEFLDWITGALGASPQVSAIVEPQAPLSFKEKPDNFTKIAFFSEFELVRPRVAAAPKEVSPFRFGRPPDWNDLAAKEDVILKDQLQLLDEARRWLDGNERTFTAVGFSQAGSGKTTSLKRVAIDLSQSMDNVFYLKAKDGLDVSSAAEFIKCLNLPTVLCVDNFAERADSVQSLLEKVGKSTRVLVVGVERDYRKEHVVTIFSEDPFRQVALGAWTTEECARLVEKYREAGLLGDEAAHKHPIELAKVIQHDTAAEAICRILNDFRPLRTIIASLWSAASPQTRNIYLTVALAHYCFPQGVRAHVLASALQGASISDLESGNCPLRVTLSPDGDDFIIPMNATVSSQLVELMGKEKSDRLLEAFVALANAVAPYVTRKTVMQQTAEARLAGRLFDADKVVKHLLQGRYDEFYEATKGPWQWNSRYWEQRALAIADHDLKIAVQHAKHAVSIERHPYTMTTLAHLLMRAVDEIPGLFGLAHFNEAFQLLRNAMEQESRSGRRRTKHAFFVFLRGVRLQLERGGILSGQQVDFVREVCAEVPKLFSSSQDMKSRAKQVFRLLTIQNPKPGSECTFPD